MGDVVDINQIKTDRIDRFSRVERLIDYSWAQLVKSENRERDAFIEHREKNKDANDSV